MKIVSYLPITLLFISNLALSADFSDDELIEIANEMNKTMPRVMDQFTVAKNVNAITGLYLNYIYEIDIEEVITAAAQQNSTTVDELKIRLVSNFGSIDSFARTAIDQLSIGAKNQYCTTPDDAELEPRYLAEKGVTTVHKFYNKSGIFVGSYSFDKNTCG